MCVCQTSSNNDVDVIESDARPKTEVGHVSVYMGEITSGFKHILFHTHKGGSKRELTKSSKKN